MRALLKKFLKNKHQIKEAKLKNFVLPKIKEFNEVLSSKDDINFLHYGHLGDIINSLPILKEISKNKHCNLFIQKNKELPKDVLSKDHLFGKVYLTENSIKKILPLLKNQIFLNMVDLYDGQKIDIDLNFFREMPINFNIDSVRWYGHLVGKHPDLSLKYLEVDNHDKFKNYIVIMRSLRRQNKFIDYSFLSSYKNKIFVGLKNEYEDLKNSVNGLEYYDSKDFLELASIIKNSKIFIGNLSFGYSLAEALKVPRLLESGPNFPLVYPNGQNAFDFYFQNHFEELVKKLDKN